MSSNTQYDSVLNITFCLFQQIVFFTCISIDDKMYSTLNDIELPIKFNELERELSKKVCKIELFYYDNGDAKSVSYYIEIYPGYNKAYCFLDEIDKTYEFIFYRKNIEAYLQNKFDIYSKKYKQKISIGLNSMNLNDRANLILINCPNKTNILNNDKCIIDLEQFDSSIRNYDLWNSYMIFYNNNDFEQIISKEIRTINELNFKSIYNKYKNDVEEMYNGLITMLDTEEFTFKIHYKKIKTYYQYLVNIIYNNYVLPKLILKKELNNNEYIYFIYKIVLFAYINRELEKDENTSLSDIKNLKNKLDKSFTKIKDDNDIEIYDKILLLINIYLSQFYNNNEEINYFNISTADKDSPLALSIQFLNEFIDELDNDSIFYYPLLLIDGGLFNYNYKNNYWLRTFGINMNTVQDIKKHLRKLIPNIIIYSSNLNQDNDIYNYGYIYPINGIVTLNTKRIGENCAKKEIDEKIRKHKAFMISRVLFHEIFGHKKSSFSKDFSNENILSAVCFKDNIDGKFRFLSGQNNENLFKDIHQILNEEIEESPGESGYFIEYFFGKIDGYYTVDLLDKYENETNLGLLLNSYLWHKGINQLKNYIKLKKYIIDNNVIYSMKENNNINEEINQMENIVSNMQNNSKENQLFKKSKIKHNFFKDNKQFLLNNININKTEKKKIKTSSNTKGINTNTKNKLGKIDILFKEAFNPFDLDKILKLERLYPNVFCKK